MSQSSGTAANRPERSQWRIARLISRGVILGLALAATALYLWQVQAGWADQTRAGLATVSLSVRGFLSGHNPSSRELEGTGIGTGSHATMYFPDYGTMGVMQVQDMPVLPASKVFELWCIDDSGHIEASSLFRVPVEAQDADVVEVSAPHLLNSYVHFLITIESTSGGSSPSRQVVMRY